MLWHSWDEYYNSLSKLGLMRCIIYVNKLNHPGYTLLLNHILLTVHYCRAVGHASFALQCTLYCKHLFNKVKCTICICFLEFLLNNLNMNLICRLDANWYESPDIPFLPTSGNENYYVTNVVNYKVALRSSSVPAVFHFRRFFNLFKNS